MLVAELIGKVRLRIAGEFPPPATQKCSTQEVIKQ